MIITSELQSLKHIRKTTKYLVLILLTLLVILTISMPSWAQVSGSCSNCHTMHNSQHNNTLDTDGPNGTLLTSDCVGCHSSSESSTYYELGECKVPVVLFTGNEPTEYLAGGNFYWVKEGLGEDDSKGHNAFLGEDDDILDKAPGGTITCSTNACHQNLSQPYSGSNMSFGLSGNYGCTGCHINAKHHAPDHANGTSGLVDNKDEGWYRFLSGHGFTGNGLTAGVEGYEDGLWEAGLHKVLSEEEVQDDTDHLDSTVHNEYLGSNKVNGNYGFELGHTTTAFCTGCHGLFHKEQQDANALWVRHPSDAIIPSEGEYQFCTTYDPLSPVARAELPTEPSGKVTPGSDMVMCLSCHRPHGSPYPDMLRWDYTRQISGGGDGCDVGTGCFFCHTTKDD
jgi:hypothetical protein